MEFSPKKFNNTRNQVTTHTHTYRTKKTLILLEINKKILENVEKYSFSVKKMRFLNKIGLKQKQKFKNNIE